jgi:thymidylate kinase
MIIAFMGNDGSGKTTISTYVYEVLFSKGLQVYYKPEFEYFLVRYIMNFLGKQRKNLMGSFASRTSIQNRSFPFKIWPYVVWVDFLFFWLFLKIFKRNKIIILDRYLYDFLISWEYLGYANELLRLLYLNFPMPDKPFVCKVCPQIAYARKANYSINFYRIQTKRYEALARYFGIQIIDTSKPLKETLEEVSKDVLASAIGK